MTKTYKDYLRQTAVFLLATIGLGCALPAYSRVVYQHTPAGMGTVHSNAVANAHGSDQDVTAYDNFILKGSANVTRITWRGTASDKNSVGFAIKIYPAKSDPSRQPDITHPLVVLDLPGNAGEKSAGNNLSDYYADFAEPLALTAGIPYWISIVSKRGDLSPWGWASGTGGDGKSIQAYSEFKVLPAPGDRVFSLHATNAHPRKR